VRCDLARALLVDHGDALSAIGPTLRTVHVKAAPLRCFACPGERLTDARTLSRGTPILLADVTAS